MTLTKTCSVSGKEFVITDDDMGFYAKMGVPSPTLCPDERQRRRLSYRNESRFYNRKCDATQKPTVSVYSATKVFPVYDQKYWWSDNWDALSYGRDFDFDRPFFEQFYELSNQVPRPSILNAKSENSIYTNHSEENKNCYMCINTGFSEDCYYCSNYNLNNTNCVDCFCIQKCECGYFLVDSKCCSYSSFLCLCMQCSDCSFCFDCRSCQNCFGCWNLRHKKYCLFNKQLTKETYEEELRKVAPISWAQHIKMFQQLCVKVEQDGQHCFSVTEKSENCSGDYIFDSKSIRNSYFALGCEDCSYCYDFGKSKTCYDSTEIYDGELEYETHACNSGYALFACSKCYHDSNIFYCQYCHNSSDLFGCFGLKKQKYCILNKQYTKKEYFELKERIIGHMKKTGEWGEFFPVSLSPFGYNETAAQEYYPLTKEAVLARGYNWKDEEEGARYKGPKHKVPNDIREVRDDILETILTCEATEKNYRIVKSELDFYRKMKVPIPLLHPEERHRLRMALRNSRKLWDRKCATCSCDIQTTYSPDRPEKVLCEECYLKEVN